mmetsp:Transcript_8189/g.20130  ORF Transcript_8189/g.20130 Transcript_8189/m.20130 type:complete len:338 (+) Transcript_8189:20-1033(+)
MNMNVSTTKPAGNRHKSLVIISGASRGIGRAIAFAITDAVQEPIRDDDDDDDGKSRMMAAPLRMVLMARSAESLVETARLVDQRCTGGDGGSANVAVTTSCHAVDFSDLDALPEKLQRILEPLSEDEAYESCWLINNAGSLGPLGLASSVDGGSDAMKELRNAVDVNVTSSIWLSSQFARTFLSTASAPSSSTAHDEKSPLVRIVNISSLCAIKPFPTMSIYCAGKAGRDMFHSVLAKEHSTRSTQNDKESTTENDESCRKQIEMLKVLNYAPGACDTRMTDELSECSNLDAEVHQYVTSSKQENKLIRPRDTAQKLVKILCLDEFQSGAHVDYWDV